MFQGNLPPCNGRPVLYTLLARPITVHVHSPYDSTTGVSYSIRALGWYLQHVPYVNVDWSYVTLVCYSILVRHHATLRQFSLVLNLGFSYSRVFVIRLLLFFFFSAHWGDSLQGLQWQVVRGALWRHYMRRLQGQAALHLCNCKIIYHCYNNVPLASAIQAPINNVSITGMCGSHSRIAQ